MISGFLSPSQRLANHRRFVPDIAFPQLIANGFPVHSEWLDDDIRLIKSGHNQAATSWHQPPTYNEKYQLAIVARARIHDRNSLLCKLDLGSDAATTDIDLILAAYRKWGRDCPLHLLGDYAFAIWDAKDRTLFCARDHIGTVPFYYSDQSGEFVFSSDIGVILDSHVPGLELDQDWMIAKLQDRRNYKPEQTHYRGIWALPPGHCLTLQAGRTGEPKINRYWRPEETERLTLANDAAYAEALREQIDLAVADCLPMPAAGKADGYGPGLGVHVSGGLDSSAIASLAIRHLERQGRPKPAAFCWQPEPDEESTQSAEHQWLHSMVEKEGLTLNYARADEDLSYALFCIDGTREPLTSTYSIEAMVQQQAESENIGVMLSGWGGDELSSHNGRTYYPWLFRTGRWGNLWANMHELTRSPFRNFIVQGFLPQLPEKIQQWLLGKRSGGVHGGQQDTVPATSLLNPELSGSKLEERKSAATNCAVHDMQLFLLNNGHLTERIESWAHHGARRGLEYRYPLLDRRVIEFALSLPPEQYKRGKWNRFIFRNAVRPILPATVVDNPSKDEPVRVDFTSAINKRAMKRIAKEIRAGGIRVDRSEFFDMEKLLSVMEGRTKERSGAASHALSILDLK